MDQNRLLELSGISKKFSNPLVSVVTRDNISLNGLYIANNKQKNIFINIHGTASNFYDEPFIGTFAEKLPENNWSFLSTNNRGHDILTGWTKKQSGDATEIFEKCLLDIDAWIEFAKDLGYKNIILCGHSLGAEKVVYYMNKGKFTKDVNSIILLGPADSFEYQYNFMNKKNIKEMLFNEAKNLIKNKKGFQCLSSYWHCHFDVLPQSATSFMNFFEENSELSKVLPFSKKSLPMFRTIKTPILAITGNMHEFTVIPPKDAMQLLEDENISCKTHILNCDHDFDGKVDDLWIIIEKFIKDVKNDYRFSK
jgi:pimeloyl-ACP methyl ester carboxylesterase